MGLEVTPATDDDFVLFIPPLFDTMGAYGFVATMYPNNHTEKGQALAIERFVAERKFHTGIKWVVVRDTSNIKDGEESKIVGVAQWAVQEDAGQPRPENLSFAPPVVWADDAQKEYAHALWDSYAAGRRKMVEQGEFPMIYLNILCVWPHCQRQGAGSSLMGWGCRLADEIKAICSVEASGAGLKLYEKHGYILQEEYTLQVPERLGPAPKGAVRFMVRPRINS